ncbi:MAG: SH3 domain-containing protein [Chloroflexota bacterium]
MGNYWEPADDKVVENDRSYPLTLHESNDRSLSRPARSAQGSPIYPVSGSSGGYGGDPPPPPGGSGGGGRWGDDDRGEFGYYEEERYWTDYLRIAMPILGVLLMVAVFWFWVANWLGDDNGNGDVANGDTNGLPTIEPTETIEDEAEADETQDDPVELPTATESEPDDGEPGATEEEPGETEEPEETNGSEEETNGGGEIYPGATVEIANTGGAGVNVRSEPTTEAEVLDIFMDGVQVTTTDDAVEAEGFIWWPITGNGVELGWIVDDYLILIE